MRRAAIVWSLCAGLAILIAGCFPVMIDVDRNGRALIARQEGVLAVDLKSDGKAELVTKPLKGIPAWARWSPDSSRVLVGEVIGKTGKTALYVVTMAGRTVKDLGEFGEVACALWSPDGDVVSVAEVGQKGFDIKTIKLASLEKKTVLECAMASHDWLPDGKIAACKVGSSQKSGAYGGQVVLVDPASPGQFTSVASVSVDSRAVLDASPDGKSVLVVQVAEGEEGSKLSLVSLPDGDKKTVVLGGVYGGFWSPDGQKIAIIREASRSDSEGVVIEASPDDEGGPRFIFTAPREGGEIVVTEPDGSRAKTVARNVAIHSEYFQSNRFFPSWADAQTVVCLERVKVYGDAGVALHLVSVKFNGVGREDLQMGIEKKVAEAVKP